MKNQFKKYHMNELPLTHFFAIRFQEVPKKKRRKSRKSKKAKVFLNFQKN